MNVLLKYIRTNVRKILSVLIFISILLILFLGFAFLEGLFTNKAIILALFTIAVIQVFVLQYFFKNQLKNDVTRKTLATRASELKRAYIEAEKLADHKTVYLENMSYEVRTPLSTVMGMLNMLKQTDLDADQKAQVEIAEYSSKHLLQLVDMVTNNAEVGTNGELTLNNFAIDLKVDLTRLFKIFEYQSWEKGLEFEYKFLSEENEKFQVIGDSERIQQVLINLINNAIKFTNSGKISIIVDQTIGIDNYQIITFYVKDTGVGMKPEEVRRIFKDSEKKAKVMMLDYRGGGIGLSISHQLVKLMGGELKLETKENEGSTFYFSLQLKKTLNLKTEEEPVKPVLKEKFNVLVAEDNRMNQKVIKFLLEREGADCTFVKNGIEALELYKILDFDMVFMDIYMPDMDGYEATELIRKTQKYLDVKTPIIGVSASAFEADISNAQLAGIDEFLSKPIEVEKLKTLLVKYSKEAKKL